MTSRDFTILSTADWDNPYWTNKQHVARELARHGNRVLYVELLGLRRPRANVKDFSRIIRRLIKGLRPPRLVESGVWVCSPLVLPLHRFSIVRYLNRYVLNFSLRKWLATLSLQADVLWTYSPMTLSVADVSIYKTVVYHSVDNIKAQPGMPREAIERAERELSERADIVFTTSKALYEAHKRLNECTYYFSNVCDYEHFHRALDISAAVPADLEIIPKPRIGFVGAISGYKLNFDLIAKVAESHSNWQIVMIGEVGEGEPETDISLLSKIKNVHFLGGRSYASLPFYLKGIDVAILPNNINEYTKSMFPMKFYEYLAAGRPIVSTRLPALFGLDNLAFFADSSSEFANAIDSCLTGNGPTLEARLIEASAQTYATRTAKMLAILDKFIWDGGNRGFAM